MHHFLLRTTARVLLAALALTLAACTAERLKPLAPDTVPDAAADAGYVLLSVTKNAGSNAWVAFRALGGEARPFDAQGHSYWHRRNDFPDTKGSTGQLMFVALPSGHYELVNWRLLAHTSVHRNRELGPAALPPINFFVRKSEVVYLGNFDIHAQFAYAESLPDGLRPMRSVGITIADRSERDLALFRERYAAFAEQPVRVSVKTRPEWDLRIEGH